jgi:hypothetical protein
MPWWKWKRTPKPRKPVDVDTDPHLARFRQELVDHLGEKAAYRVRLSPQGTATEFTATWDPLPSYEAVEHVGHLISGPPYEIFPSDLEIQPDGTRWVVLCRPSAGGWKRR